MIEKIDYWENFKGFVRGILPDYGDNTVPVLVFGISSKVTEVFEVSQLEISQNKRMNKERINAIKKVLIYIAHFELLYNFPRCPYTNFLGTDFKDDESIINLLDTHSEALNCCARISDGVIDYDLPSIQLALNNLLLTMLDICHAHDIDTKDCVSTNIPGSSKEVVKSNKPKQAAPNMFQKAFVDARRDIKKSGKTQALFDLNLVEGNKYRGVILKILNTKKRFYSQNVIVDFFTASNYLHDNFNNIEYSINYSRDFRSLLSSDPSNLYMGYLVENKIVIASDKTAGIAQGKDKSYLTKLKNGRPVLLNPDIKTLDSMLAMVNAVRQTVKK